MNSAETEVVYASSKAGSWTVLQVRVGRLRVQFDCGRVGKGDASGWGEVFLSHGHLDHCGAVASLARARSLVGLETRFYAPKDRCSKLEDALRAFEQLDEGHGLLAKVLPVDEGDRVNISKDTAVVACRAFHRVPGVGYAIVQTKKKMKEEFKNLPKEEKIKVLADPGNDVFQINEKTVFAYTGDTTVDCFEVADNLYLSAETLALEITFLGPDRSGQCSGPPNKSYVSIDFARERGHIHAMEFLELYQRGLFSKCRRFIFLHFSARYTVYDMADFFLANFPPNLLRMIEPVWEDFGVREKLDQSLWATKFMFKSLGWTFDMSQENHSLTLWNILTQSYPALLCLGNDRGVSTPAVLVRPTNQISTLEQIVWISMYLLEKRPNQVALVEIEGLIDERMKALSEFINDARKHRVPISFAEKKQGTHIPLPLCDEVGLVLVGSSGDLCSLVGNELLNVGREFRWEKNFMEVTFDFLTLQH